MSSQKGRVPPNKLTLDETAFDILDEERAAMLGLLMADGTLTLSYGYPSLSLKLIDREPLTRLQAILKTSHKIGEVHPHLKGYVCKPQYQVRFYGLRRLGPKLQGLGLTHPNATRVPRSIPQELERHLIRGYFEGGGSCWFDARQRGVCSNFVGHPLMLGWIRLILKEAGISGCYARSGGGDCWRIQFRDATSKKLYHYLYDGATVILIGWKKRKFENTISQTIKSSLVNVGEVC